MNIRFLPAMVTIHRSVVAALPEAITNVLAAHIGNGAVMLTWDIPVTAPDFYEVWGSSTLGGTYYKYMNGKFITPRGVVYNVPVGITAYFKVRSCTNGLYSAFVQAKTALIQQPTATMNVTAVEGSVIPIGATFTLQDNGGRLVAFSAESEIIV